MIKYFRNYIDTFALNPQFKLTLEDSSEELLLLIISHNFSCKGSTNVVQLRIQYCREIKKII